MMNPIIKEEWALNLESGGVKQVGGMLSSNGSFCCLGVLCEMAVVAGVVEKQNHNYRLSLKDKVCYQSTDRLGDNSTSLLPYAVQKWAGIGDNNPICGGESLSTLNDAGMEFTEIAQKIRKYL